MVKHFEPTIADSHGHAWVWRLKGRVRCAWNAEKTNPRKRHKIQQRSLPVPAELGCLVAKSRLCGPMDYNLPGSSVHGVSQARITREGCHSFLQGIQPVSPALARGSFTTSTIWEALRGRCKSTKHCLYTPRLLLLSPTGKIQSVTSLFPTAFSLFFLRLFFKCRSFLKILFEFVTVLPLFYVLFFFWTQAMWDLSSPPRNWTCSPWIGRWSLNHWITRAGPIILIIKSKNTNLFQGSTWTNVYSSNPTSYNPSLLFTVL